MRFMVGLIILSLFLIGLTLCLEGLLYIVGGIVMALACYFIGTVAVTLSNKYE